MQYTIDVTIDTQGLDQISKSGQCVTIVESVSSIVQPCRNPRAARSVTGTTTVVAWLAFQPFENNAVTWTASYFGYAATTLPPMDGAIAVRSMTKGPMSPGNVSTFLNGQFQTTQGTSPYYIMENGSSQLLYFGLAQSATINNASTPCFPEVIVPVLSGQDVFFMPTSTVSLFLSSAQKGGTVLPALPANALPIKFSSSNPHSTVGFNDATNLFFLIT